MSETGPRAPTCRRDQVSTRGVIARAVGDGWEGRYHHFDSEPSGLGRTGWRLYHGHFAGDVDAMLRTIVDEHPSGWSTIIDADFSQPAGFGLPTGANGKQPPSCYCHGSRSDKPHLFFEHGECQGETCGSDAIEWVYVLSSGGMAILQCQDGRHVPTVFVPWHGPEPRWPRS